MTRETAIVKTHVSKSERDRLKEIAARESRSIASLLAYLIRRRLLEEELNG